jgi:site-specific DNA-methyltransferase (cytosine-N4-specific)
MKTQLSLLQPPRRHFASTPAERIEAVRAADWNFSTARTQGGVHGLHPYPAKFIPQIPRQLLELLHPGDESAVLDPFCGSGTTLVEAQVHGCPAIGIDLNPLAALIARVKTHPPAKPLTRAVADTLTRAMRWRGEIPEIPRLDHWFEPEVQASLAALVTSIRSVSDDRSREALQVALSSIIVRVSNQESDTRYAAIKKLNLDREYVFEGFRRAATDMEAAFGQQYGSVAPNNIPPVEVLTRDVLRVTPSDIGQEVGLVITSPPYPNAYEYWLYHKYRMYWLGMDPISVRLHEIGARPHYFKKNPHTAADFERQLGTVFSLISGVLRSDGLACFVVGRSIIHGEVIDNEAALQRAGRQHGFRLLTSVARSIPNTRKAFNPSHGTINREVVAVFGR